MEKEMTNYKLNVNSDKYKFIVLGDPHIDSEYCEKKLLKKHLEYALKNNIDVYCIGDLLDVMQGRNDPRRKNKQEFENYFNYVINIVTNFLTPYKNIIKHISYGNHETSVVKNNDIDLLQIIVNNLNLQGANINIGSYEGWLQFKLIDGTSQYNFKTKYHHGHGGAAPMTKGLLTFMRDSIYLGEVDLILQGHTHTKTEHQIYKEYINQHGNISIKQVNMVRVPSYKFQRDGNGWAVEKGMKQDPIGSVLFELQYNKYKGINFQTTFLNEFYD